MNTGKMSLARAFTTRRNKNENTPAPYIGRAASTRSPDSKPIMRSQISLPVALISTTNMLSYEAPDIAGTTRIIADRYVSSSHSVTSSSSSVSGDDSDASSTSAHSRGTITDASSVDESYSPTSPEPNHLSCYFKPNVPTTTNVRSSTNSTISSTASNSPVIPQRALSHSKQAHVQMSRVRSVRRSNGNTRDSLDMFASEVKPEPTSSHPFGKELEQLNEVAEEFGTAVRDAEADADRAIMQAKGLVQICAADYMQEIASYYTNTFAEDAMSYQQVAWI